MKLIYNILVIVDPQQNNEPTLSRAKELAKIMQAQLHLLVCSSTKTKKDETLLKDLTAALLKEGFKATFETAWHESYHNTIITTQKAQNFGLVIKSHVPTKSISNVILTPEDWKLLRTCPCPILIVNQDRPWLNRPMLASVDLGNPDKNHVELHNMIVKVANAFTYVNKSELHLVSVYPALIFSETHPNTNAAKIPNEIYKIYYNACQEYQNEYDIPDNNIHLCAGAPDIIIPNIAESIDAAVCVIGTVARTGISGVLIGNTAEAILDDLTCDILVLKPEGISEELEQLIKNFNTEK